jgi:hypothetical protein
MGGAHFAPGSNFGRSNFAAFPRSRFYPLALGDSLFYPDYLSAGYPIASPPVIFVQAPPAAETPAPAQPVQPLMIELQGDRYVRIGAEDTSGTEMITREAKPSGAATRAQELVPATLVFRDGHREEVSEYTIAGGVLYSRSNYYTDGSWTRKIDLSSLNLPETIASNQSRGVPFQLPNSPNEVIVGP